jgi:CubicO group peptidase (beta-lactamase class C family)
LGGPTRKRRYLGVDLFRVFSNTKLITSCAALLLFEGGRFQLDDPIEQFIPQLANRRVLRPDAMSLDQIEPVTLAEMNDVLADLPLVYHPLSGH